MEKARILESLIKEKGYNLRSFAEKCNMPYTTLYGIMKRGVGKAGVDNIITICENLNITVDELETMARGSNKEKYQPTYEDMQDLIARNGRKLSPEEKMRLIKMLTELEE